MGALKKNKINIDQNLVESILIIAANYEPCQAFFSFLQKHATDSKQAILRRFFHKKNIQNLLKMHGFIDIGLQSYKTAYSLVLRHLSQH